MFRFSLVRVFLYVRPGVWTIFYSVVSVRVSDLTPKWVRLAPNGTNPGFLNIGHPCFEGSAMSRWVIFQMFSDVVHADWDSYNRKYWKVQAISLIYSFLECYTIYQYHVSRICRQDPATLTTEEHLLEWSSLTEWLF